jgi:hypothetical protein
VNGSAEEMKALTDVLCKGNGDEEIKCKEYVEGFKNSWAKDNLFKVRYSFYIREDICLSFCSFSL